MKKAFQSKRLYRIGKKVVISICLMPILCLIIGTLSTPAFAAQIRKVTGKGMGQKDKSAINWSLENVRRELKNTVHKTGSETIYGDKKFRGPSPWIDVKAFGAVGDSSTDDTAEIQAAIDYAEGLITDPPWTQCRPTVRVGPGVYVVSSKLTINKGIRLVGAGPSATVIAATHNGTIIEVDGNGTDIYYMEISDLRIEGRNGGTSVVGILLTGDEIVNSSTFFNNHILGCYTAILNEITAEDYGGNSIASNYISNYGGSNTYYGIRYTGGHTVGDIISQNRINLGPAAGYGFHMVDYAAGTVGVGDINIHGNYINNGVNSVYIEADPTKYRANFRVSSNSFMDTSSYPVVLKGVSNSTFFPNTMTDITGSDSVSQDGNCTQNLVDEKGSGIQTGGSLVVNSTYTNAGLYLNIPTNAGWTVDDQTVRAIGYSANSPGTGFALGTTSNHPLYLGTNNTFNRLVLGASGGGTFNVSTNSGWVVNDGTVNGIGYATNSPGVGYAIGTTTNHPLYFGTNNTFTRLEIGAAGGGTWTTATNSGVTIKDGTNTGIIFNSSTLTNSFAIGTTSNTPLILGTNNTFPRLVIEAGGDVGIGTSNPGYKLEVNGTVLGDYYSSDGTAGLTDNSSYWLCSASDCSSTCQVTIKDGLITGCP